MTKKPMDGDLQAWAWGILASNGIGALTCACFVKFAGGRGSNFHLWHTSLPANDAGTCCFYTGLLLLPPFVTALARRRHFAWAFLPLPILFLWAYAVMIRGMTLGSSLGWPALAFQSDIHLFFSAPTTYGWMGGLAAAGLLLLGRRAWNRSKSKARRNGQVFQIQREAASVPQERIWPPPPDHRRQE